jgi:tetratricopeptide (TPR) repeat protein
VHSSNDIAQNSKLKRLISFALVIAVGAFIYINLIAPNFTQDPILEDVVLAVFPFEQENSSEPSNISGEALTNGVNEKLSLIQGLTTISSISLTHNKNIFGRARVISISNDKQLLDSLRATHYIKGFIDSAVHLNLYSINNNKPLWTRHFKLNESTKLYDLICKSIADKLHLKYDIANKERDPRVIALYVAAMPGWHSRRDKAQLNDAIRLLNEALTIDPNDAEVNGMLALCYVVGVERQYYRFDSVKSNIVTLREKALDIDPSQAYALLAAGGYYFALNDYDKAREYYIKAHKKAPGLGISLQALAEFALYTGDYQSALKNINMANGVTPNDETILQFLVFIEMANGFANASKRLAERFVLLYPERDSSEFYLWADYLISKKYDQAIEAIPPVLKRRENYNRLFTGIVYIDQKNKSDFDDLFELSLPYADQYLRILWSLHNGDEEDKEVARADIIRILDAGPFMVLNLIQTYPFLCFNSFRTDPSVVRIFRERGIDLSPHPYFRIQSELRK